MNELVEKILQENLLARKEELASLENIIADRDAKKIAYEEAEENVIAIGDIDVAKEKLTAEISELENYLFPADEEDEDDDDEIDTLATEELVAE